MAKVHRWLAIKARTSLPEKMTQGLLLCKQPQRKKKAAEPFKGCLYFLWEAPNAPIVCFSSCIPFWGGGNTQTHNTTNPTYILYPIMKEPNAQMASRTLAVCALRLIPSRQRRTRTGSWKGLPKGQWSSFNTSSTETFWLSGTVPVPGFSGYQGEKKKSCCFFKNTCSSEKASFRSFEKAAQRFPDCRSQIFLVPGSQLHIRTWQWDD